MARGLRAEDRARTGHPDLGKVVLYQMSYFRFYKTILLSHFGNHLSECERTVCFLGLQRYRLRNSRKIFFRLFVLRCVQSVRGHRNRGAALVTMRV